MAQNTLFFQERELNADATFQKSILNIPKAWAAVNRKNAPVTDTKGYLNTYICKVEVISTDVVSYLHTAPENWVIKNAVRRWHLARQSQREEMFGGRAGTPTYGKTIRPMFDANHQTTNNVGDYYELQPLKRSGAMTGGSWDFTKMAHAVGNLNTNNTNDVQGEELSDSYYLTLTGVSVLETGHTTGGHNKYSHVSMPESYILARRNIAHDAGDDVLGEIDYRPSPLVELQGNTPSSTNVAQILGEEQNLAPPYAMQDDTGAVPTDVTQPYYAGVLATTSSYGRDSVIIRVPGGLLSVWSQATGGAVRLPFYNVEVLGVTRAEG